MASFQKTFRKSGSHHAEFHSLQGVEIKIGEKFRPPKKVTLPVGWQQKDPSAALSLLYDFSLEKDVVSKADALRASKQEQLESSSGESQATSTSVETTCTPATQNSVFSNVGSEILQPVVASGTGHKKKDSFGGKGKNAFDISDFEGDTSTPFELVELQTINDMDELKNVLQPNAVPVTTTETSSNSYDSTPNVPPANTSGGNINLPTNSLSSSGNSLVDISGLRIADRNPAPVSNLPDSTNLTTNNSGTEASTLLVDIGETRTSLATPAAGSLLTNSGSLHDNSLPSTSLNSETRPWSRGGLLPPIGQSFPPTIPQQSQGQQSFPIPTHSSASTCRNATSGGVYSFPNSVGTTQGQQLTTEKQDADTQSRQYSPPSYAPCVRDQQWNVPRSPDYQNIGARYPSPLPPIGTSSEEPNNRQTASYRSSLPDPSPILNETEASFVKKFVGMGFPTPRVARAVQRLGTKDKEVVEFLVNVQELCENKTYSPDSVEVALVFNPEKAKVVCRTHTLIILAKKMLGIIKGMAVEFLELVKTFKEYGFKEDNIHECLRAADNDSEKALEYLMTLSST